MPQAVRHYPSLEIAEAVYSGVITAKDLEASTRELVAIQRQHGVIRFLVTLGDSEARISPAELESLLDEQYWQEDVNRSSRIAIVQATRQSAKDAAAFFVAACRKRGWKSEVLADRRAAMDWLAPGARP